MLAAVCKTPPHPSNFLEPESWQRRRPQSRGMRGGLELSLSSVCSSLVETGSQDRRIKPPLFTKQGEGRGGFSTEAEKLAAGVKPQTSGVWVYPVLERITPLARVVFFSAMTVVICIFYVLGEILNNYIWDQTHT
ncbi:hypothetical protein INR49_008205, partial [Caranx melampygus]